MCEDTLLYYNILYTEKINSPGNFICPATMYPDREQIKQIYIY